MRFEQIVNKIFMTVLDLSSEWYQLILVLYKRCLGVFCFVHDNKLQHIFTSGKLSELRSHMTSWWREGLLVHWCWPSLSSSSRELGSCWMALTRDMISPLEAAWWAGSWASISASTSDPSVKKSKMVRKVCCWLYRHYWTQGYFHSMPPPPFLTCKFVLCVFSR